MFITIKPSFLLLLGCLFTFQIFAQSWETEVEEIQEIFESFVIGEFYQGEYLISGKNHTLRLDGSGNILGLGEGVPNRKKFVFQDKIYSFSTEASIFEEGNAIDVTIHDKQGQILELFEIASSAAVLRAVILSDSTIAMLNYYSSSRRNYLEKYSSNGTLLKRVLLSETGTNPRNMIVTKDGRLITFDSSNFGQISSFDSNLNRQWILSNQTFEGRVHAVTSDEAGNIYFAASTGDFLDQNYRLGTINKIGELQRVVSIPGYKPEDSLYSLWISDIAIQDNSIAILFSSPETNEDLVVTCFDKDLNEKHTFTKNNGGFSSNIVPNNVGGYVFGFGLSNDPTNLSYRTNKTAVFYSLDSLCRISSTTNTLIGSVFHDINGNSTKDSTEVGLSNIELLHLADSTIYYTDENGHFEIENLSGEGTVQLLNIAPFWMTDSMTYTINSTMTTNIPLQCNSLKDAVFTKQLDCKSTEIVLDATNSDLMDANYLWNTGATTSSISVNQASTYEATVSTTNEYCVLTSVITFDVLEQANDLEIIKQNELCSGQSTILTATSGFQNYLWNTGDTTRSIQINDAGIYSVEASRSDSCIYVEALEVEIAESPKVEVLIWPTCSENDNTYFLSILKDTTQLWLVNQDTISQDDVDDIYTFVVPIGENLILRILDIQTGCDNYKFFISPSCNNSENRTPFQHTKTLVYPNPFKNSFTLQRPAIEEGNILCFDTGGNLIIEQKWTEGYQKTIDLKGFPSGIYWYRILSPRGITQGKIIKLE